MTRKRLVLRRIVRADVAAATRYYTEVAGRDVALSFADALQAARHRIADMHAQRDLPAVLRETLP